MRHQIQRRIRRESQTIGVQKRTTGRNEETASTQYTELQGWAVERGGHKYTPRKARMGEPLVALGNRSRGGVGG